MWNNDFGLVCRDVASCPVYSRQPFGKAVKREGAPRFAREPFQTTIIFVIVS